MVKDLDPDPNFQASMYLSPLTHPENNQKNVLQYFWKNRQKFKILDDALLYGNKIFLIPPESSYECLQQWREVRTSSVLR